MGRFWLVLLIAFGLSGCLTTSPKTEGLAEVGSGHGGGFAMLRDGSYLSIDDAGQVSGRCLMCQTLADDGGACESKAKAMGVAICKVTPVPAVQASVRAMMCSAYGPTGALPPVPFGTAGYQCFMTTTKTCICLATQ